MPLFPLDGTPVKIAPVMLCAPYQRHEITTIALRLLEVLRSLEVPALLTTYGRLDDQVHHVWDRDIRVIRTGFSPEKLDSRFRTVVWFDVHKRQVLALKKTGRRNILVASWARLSKRHCSSLDIFDKVVALHYMSSVALEVACRHKPVQAMPRWVPSFPRIVKKWSPLAPTRCFIPLAGNLSPPFCTFLVRLLKSLFEADPLLEVTLCSRQLTFSRGCRTELAAMEKEKSGQLMLIHRRSYEEYVALLAFHDWLILPQDSELFLITLAEAAYCDIPTVAWKIPPFETAILHKETGHVVECNARNARFGLPSVVRVGERSWQRDEREFLRTVCDAVVHRRALEEMRKNLRKFWQEPQFETECANLLLD